MKLIVGLGNPGKKYEQTRHNVGFAVVDRLAARFGDGTAKDKFAGRMMEATIAGERALLLWPQTLMNLSGESVGPALEFYKLELRICWSFATTSICHWVSCGFAARDRPAAKRAWPTLSDDWVQKAFGRLRLGIGPVPEQWDAADFVLGRFDAAERDEIDQAVERAVAGTECWAAEGIAASMNKFN